MNSDLTPAFIAAGGGTAMLAGIWTRERRMSESMRRARQRLHVRFPVGLDPVAAFAVLDGFSGLPGEVELVAEVAASEDRIAHYLWVPASVRDSVESMVRGVIPSVRLTEAPTDGRAVATLASRVFVPTPALLVADVPVSASRTLLAGLTGLRAGEQVVVRWALRAGGPRRLPSRDQANASVREIERAWRRKTTTAGMRAAGLISVRAASAARARTLAAHVESVLRSRRGQTGPLRLTNAWGSRSISALPRTTATSGWLSSAELLGLLGWPLGADVPPSVEVGAARELPVGREVARRGRVLLVGRDASGRERPVALDATAARHHLAMIGPSGVGKSTLMANGILSDITAGYGGAVIDPKRDLVQSVLERVPAEHADRIVVLDPGDDRPIPGLALLSGGDPDTRADVLTGALRAIFADVWGVRSDYYARLGIRTLAEVPGATLADLGRLFLEPAFRRAAVARLADPFLVASWQNYETLSEATQAEHVAAPMNRVMALLARPKVRAVLASPSPKLDVARLLAERKWLLVNLAPGTVGEAAAHLIGTATMYAIWTAVEARTAMAPEKRHPLFLHVDELASLSGTPFGFELLAERARGLGMGLTVALQTLGRVPEPTRSALLGNVASFITFRAGAEEAPRIARQLPGLSTDDVMALDRYEVAARVGTGAGSSIAVVTGHTETLPSPTGQAEAIRDTSAQRYGSQPDRTEHPHATGSEAVNVRHGRRERSL